MAIHVKYGILAFHSIQLFPQTKTDYKLQPGLHLLSQPKLWLDSMEKSVWKKWMGSLHWEHVSKSEIVIMSKTRTKTPEVTDQENEDLRTLLTNTVASSILLLGPYPGTYGDFVVFTGTAYLERGKLVPEDPRSHTRLDGYVRPGYVTLPEYWNWASTNLSRELKLVELTKLIHQLGSIRNTKSTYLFRMSLHLFRHAMYEAWPDFKFPQLVRSIEVLVGIPTTKQIKKAYGEKANSSTVFADRCLKYFPPKRDLPFSLTAAKVRNLLQDIYDIRSACVHGIPINDALRKKKGRKPTQKELCRYEFVAETAVRALLQNALSDKKWMKALRSRSTLEKAWLANQI